MSFPKKISGAYSSRRPAEPTPPPIKEPDDPPENPDIPIQEPEPDPGDI